MINYIDETGLAKYTTLVKGKIADDIQTESTARGSADTTLQANITAEANTRSAADTALQDNINAITVKIPGQATSENQLADKAFVNSSISTETATFRGTSAQDLTEAEFLAWANSLTKTNNDYVFWDTTDSDGNRVFKRYKYNGTEWLYEYSLNNSSFTSVQWAAINSGLSSTDKTKLNNIENGAEVNVQSNWAETDINSDSYILNKPTLATVATSGSYNDLSNKPTIPTKTSDLTNDGDGNNPFLTQHQSLSAYRTSSAQDVIDEGKVDKVTGKGLSTNDFTDAEQTKLSGIAEGAEVNVQSDWNQSDTTADDYIKNKPAVPVLPIIINNRYLHTNSNTGALEWSEVTSGVQSDWDQTDTTALDYIKNKPTIIQTITSSSGHDEIPTAKAVYDAINGSITNAIEEEY